MDWFFEENIGNTHLITGENAVHITKSLRMSVGEVLTLCDSRKVEHLCRIERINSDGVLVKVVSESECQNEPTVEITLYAALTKGDKMETVIQKSVEIGVTRIIPILTDRCISRPDEKASVKKQQRYQKIAQQASQQSRRAIIPVVEPVTELKKAVETLDRFDKIILFYEGGGKPLRELINSEDKKIAIFTGCEGGFEEREVELLISHNARCATLGKRILRAETAPLVAISAIMFHTQNLE